MVNHGRRAIGRVSAFSRDHVAPVCLGEADAVENLQSTMNAELGRKLEAGSWQLLTTAARAPLR
ncbi:MAG: hypothetical protein ACREUZ_12695 [Burkholderiales bacterium]